MEETSISENEIKRTYERLNREAEASGYHLNPDREFTEELVWGLLANENRYGYMACPCRMASGRREEDADIICPCDYRDPDLNEFDACYCALYVTGSILRGEKETESIPERRPPPDERKKPVFKPMATSLQGSSDLTFPVWRCRVCGYLCARDDPPEVCPICRATKDRFDRFL